MAPELTYMQLFVLKCGKTDEAACDDIGGTIDIVIKIAIIF